MITHENFLSLAAEGYNRIAMVHEALADLETPLSLYLKLTGSASQTAPGGSATGSFLLESVVGGERFGRYSFIGLPTDISLRSHGHLTRVLKGQDVLEVHQGNPLDVIQAYQGRFKVWMPPNMPRFCGGLAGYFGYEAVRSIEPRLADSRPGSPIGTPDILLLQTDEVAVIDNLSGRLYLIVYVDPARQDAWQWGHERLAHWLSRLDSAPSLPQAAAQTPSPVHRGFDKADYLAAVDRCKEYIAAGDMMQVQLGQRMEKPWHAHPLCLYRALRTINPSPYMYYYDFGDFQVVGASPEILVRHERVPEGEKVTIRPLAGTRRRGATPQEDQALEVELKADPKERAEHLMLIDLARNDIGRIAVTGSVKVTESFVVERYSHVMHIVSNVEGMLKPGTSHLDVLRATFPAGTLTGAPKVRAMEIIDELEPVERGIYGGACGYLSYAGDMDLAIAIRTGVIKDGTLYVQAAAGIVADSIPESEWQETEVKARALLRAAEMVEAGLTAPHAQAVQILQGTAASGVQSKEVRPCS